MPHRGDSRRAFQDFWLDLAMNILASNKHDAGGVGDGRCSHCATDIYKLRHKSPSMGKKQKLGIETGGRGWDAAG